jgi:hypothetical protein
MSEENHTAEPKDLSLIMCANTQVAMWAWALGQLKAAKLVDSPGEVGTLNQRNAYKTMRRWAKSIINEAQLLAPWSDWYWFLREYFLSQLQTVDPHEKGKDF